MSKLCVCGHIKETHWDSENLKGCYHCNSPYTQGSHCSEFREGAMSTSSNVDSGPMAYQIKMFLGYKTKTDNKEFHDYMARSIISSPEEFKKMNDEFDTHFPGYRVAASRAMRDLSRETGFETHRLEHKDGSFRALNSKGHGAWSKVIVHTPAAKICECGHKESLHPDGLCQSIDPKSPPRLAEPCPCLGYKEKND